MSALVLVPLRHQKNQLAHLSAISNAVRIASKNPTNFHWIGVEESVPETNISNLKIRFGVVLG